MDTQIGKTLIKSNENQTKIDLLIKKLESEINHLKEDQEFIRRNLNSILLIHEVDIAPNEKLDHLVEDAMSKLFELVDELRSLRIEYNFLAEHLAKIV